MVTALELARLYPGRTHVDCLALDARAVHLALDLLDTYRLGCKRIADTLLGNGVNTIMTCSPGDFAIFDVLAVIDPREATKP